MTREESNESTRRSKFMINEKRFYNHLRMYRFLRAEYPVTFNNTFREPIDMSYIEEILKVMSNKWLIWKTNTETTEEN